MLTVPNKIKELLKRPYFSLSIIVFWLIWNDGKKSYDEILRDMLWDYETELVREKLGEKSEKIMAIVYSLIILEMKEKIIIHTIENGIDYYSIDYGNL